MAQYIGKIYTKMLGRYGWKYLTYNPTENQWRFHLNSILTSKVRVTTTGLDEKGVQLHLYAFAQAILKHTCGMLHV